MSKKHYNQKSILVFTQHFWPEEFRINDLCKGLKEFGIKVDVICGIPNYPSGKIKNVWGFFKKRNEVWNDINIHRVWEIPRGNNKLFRIFINFISWPFFCLFYLPFIRQKYDYILSYQLSPVFMVLPAIIYKYLSKTPLCIYILDYWPFSVFAVTNIKNIWFKKIIKFTSEWHYKKADKIICVFEGIQKKLINDLGIALNKTIYIPQACEKLHENKIFDKILYEKYNNYFCIVFTGSINPTQSFDIIVSAAKYCIIEGYNNIHWIIVGDGLSKNEIETMVNNLGIKNNFHFEGYHPVDEMPKYYAIADAFIVAFKKSSLGDFAIPAKIQSYFAAGLPILGAMDGDGRDLINNANAGFCGPANDAKTLYKNIIKLYKLPIDERIKMGENAKAYHYKFFERDEQLKKLMNFIFKNENL